jgi:hypothetical protein
MSSYARLAQKAVLPLMPSSSSAGRPPVSGFRDSPAPGGRNDVQAGGIPFDEVHQTLPLAPHEGPRRCSGSMRLRRLGSNLSASPRTNGRLRWYGGVAAQNPVTAVKCLDE